LSRPTRRAAAAAPTATQPDAPPLLSAVALATFKLNGQLLAVAEDLSRPAGLTAARWQVLGAVLRQPLTVAGIAREMGITRQSVQRTADLLVEAGLAEYRPNPAHRTAKLVAPTDAGLTAISRISPAHGRFAERLAGELSIEDFAAIADALRRLSAALDRLEGQARSPVAEAAQPA
jgi:DNA-binding MarR family transcriptional regulator